MQRVSSRELGATAGTYIVQVPLVSEVVKFGLNQHRIFSVWFKHKAETKRMRNLRITVAPVSVDVDDTEELLYMTEVYGIWYACWGFALPEE